MNIRDRIVELRRVKASDLLINPKNPRRHPDSQLAALQGVLNEVGYVDALLVRETAEGLMLIDGHARRGLTPDMEVPVLVLDLDEAEADKILLTFDPLTAMAETDRQAMASLLADVTSGYAALRRLLDQLEPPVEPVEAVDQNDVASGPPAMELRPEEHYDFVLVLATNVNEWNRLVALLELPDVHSERKHRRIGLGRAVRAKKVLDLIDGK